MWPHVEARTKLLMAYKVTAKRCYTNLNKSDNLHLLTKNKNDLVNAWTAYSDSHVDYLTREKNEDDIATVTEEYELLDSGQDLILINMEDRIDILAPAAKHLIQLVSPQSSSVTDKSVRQMS